jgi:hypothetical protein
MQAVLGMHPGPCVPFFLHGAAAQSGGAVCWRGGVWGTLRWARDTMMHASTGAVTLLCILVLVL